MRFAIATVVAATCLAASSAKATLYNYTIFDAQYIQQSAFPTVGERPYYFQGTGLNDNGTVVGYVGDGHGVTYSLATNKVTAAPPGVSYLSVNNNGDTYGFYGGPDPLASQASTLGYLSAYVSTLGPVRVPTLTTFYIPGFGGINDLGQVVGPNFSISKTGVVTTTGVNAADINNAGTVLTRDQGVSLNNKGDYVGNSGGAFVVINGVRESFSTPFGGATLVAINDLGQILGNNGTFTFLATPVTVPEPLSVSLLAMSFVLLVGIRLRAPARAEAASSL